MYKKNFFCDVFLYWFVSWFFNQVRRPRGIKMSIEKVTSNKKTRHYTIYKIDGSIYRTFSFNKAEFEELQYDTLADWRNFLRTTDFYYEVK